MSLNYPDDEDKWRNLNAILKRHYTFISKEIDERIQTLIDIITKAYKANQLNNVSTSQIIELFNYKIDKFITSEKSMEQRLEQSSQQVNDMKIFFNFKITKIYKLLLKSGRLPI